MHIRLKELLEQVLLEFDPKDKKPRKRNKKILKARDAASKASDEEAKRQSRAGEKASTGSMPNSKRINKNMSANIKVFNRALARGGDVTPNSPIKKYGGHRTIAGRSTFKKLPK